MVRHYRAGVEVSLFAGFEHVSFDSLLSSSFFNLIRRYLGVIWTELGDMGDTCRELSRSDQRRSKASSEPGRTGKRFIATKHSSGSGVVPSATACPLESRPLSTMGDEERGAAMGKMPSHMAGEGGPCRTNKLREPGRLVPNIYFDAMNYTC
jgi:hypothetical protein